jgi:hypothetical protein
MLARRARTAQVLAAAAALVAWGFRPGYALQAPPAQAERPVTVEGVLSRMAEKDQDRAALLKTYTSLRSYGLENRRFGTKAEVRARMSFEQPGKKAFEILFEQGSGIVRKRVLQRMIKEELEASREQIRISTAITPANYTFRLLGTAEAEGRSCYLLEAAPKRRGKFLLRGRIWVDAAEFAIVRIEGSPAQNPSFLIRKTVFVHTYGKFGPFWLPVSNRSDTDVLIYGKTEVKVAYSAYVVNGDRYEAAEGGFKPTETRTSEGQLGNGADTLLKH